MCLAVAAMLSAVSVATAQPGRLNLRGGSSALCPRAEQLSPERPSSSAGPTRVGVGVFLNDLVGLDDIAQVFTADLFLVLQWTDPRLAEPARGSSLSICSLDDTQVWMPLVQFQDVRRLTKNYQDITGIDARGMVTHAQRLGLDIAVRFDLRDFPFDQHTLELEVRPVLSGVDEVEVAVLDNLTGVDERVSLTGWTIGAHTASIETRHAPRLQVDQSLFRLQLGLSHPIRRSATPC